MCSGMRKTCFCLLFSFLVLPLAAQSTRPPVVLVNGYDVGWALRGACTPSASSRDTFGSLEDFLKADGAPQVYFFDNCAQSGQQTLPNPSIEELGRRFGDFLANTVAAPQVDVVAHSMGGLIVRSYLSGKQPAFGSFMPPAGLKIRKIVFIATPHFGAPLAGMVGSSPNDMQIREMAPGSAFLWDLATWNQGFDDLRGLDALTVIGNGESDGKGDGVVSLTSASLKSLLQPDQRTRIVPYCHIPGLFFFGCPGPAIANADSSDQLTAQIVRSFLAGGTAWTQIGETPSRNAVLSQASGVLFGMKDASDSFQTPTQVSYKQSRDPSVSGQLSAGPSFFYADLLAGGSYVFDAQAGTQTSDFLGTLPPGGFQVFLGKAGPVMKLIVPAAGVPDVLALAAGSIISIYGSNLAQGTQQASTELLPTEMLGTSVLAQGRPVPLLYVSGQQINAVLPAGLSGLTPLKLLTPAGQHTLNVWISPAVPAVFTLDSSGSGPGAVLHASTNLPVTTSNPAAPGEYVSIYATGLGPTMRSGDLDVAIITPQVLIGGVPATILFAGNAPGYPGLNQINVQVPQIAAGPAVPLIVQSGGHSSNAVTLAIR